MATGVDVKEGERHDIDVDEQFSRGNEMDDSLRLFVEETGKAGVIREFCVDRDSLAGISHFFRRFCDENKPNRAFLVKDEHPRDILEVLSCVLPTKQRWMKEISMKSLALLLHFAAKWEMDGLRRELRDFIEKNFASTKTDFKTTLHILKELCSHDHAMRTILLVVRRAGVFGPQALNDAGIRYSRTLSGHVVGLLYHYAHRYEKRNDGVSRPVDAPTQAMCSEEEGAMEMEDDRAVAVHALPEFAVRDRFNSFRLYSSFPSPDGSRREYFVSRRRFNAISELFAELPPDTSELAFDCSPDHLLELLQCAFATPKTWTKKISLGSNAFRLFVLALAYRMPGLREHCASMLVVALEGDLTSAVALKEVLTNVKENFTYLMKQNFTNRMKEKFDLIKNSPSTDDDEESKSDSASSNLDKILSIVDSHVPSTQSRQLASVWHHVKLTSPLLVSDYKKFKDLISGLPHLYKLSHGKDNQFYIAKQSPTHTPAQQEPCKKAKKRKRETS